MAVRITRAGVALTVGIIVVTGLIIGGLFWAKQSGEQARHNAATKIAEQNLEDQSKNIALNNGDSSSNNSSNSSQNSSNSSSNTTDNFGSTTQNNSSDNSNSTNNSSNSSQSSSTTELPKTGISDITPIIGAGLLAFIGAAYYRSRRTLFELR